MLRKEVLLSYVLSAKAEKIVKCVSERKGKEVQRRILAKDVWWQVRFEQFADQVAKLSEKGRLDAESIADVKTRIAISPLTALLVREKVAEAAPPVPPLSPSTSGCHI
jgi:hypothetical protein